MQSKEPITIPDYNKIISHCVIILIKNHIAKKNTWVDYDNDLFWTSKLKEELAEVLKEIDSFVDVNDIPKVQKELIDLINIASMMYDNLERLK